MDSLIVAGRVRAGHWPPHHATPAAIGGSRPQAARVQCSAIRLRVECNKCCIWALPHATHWCSAHRRRLFACGPNQPRVRAGSLEAKGNT